MSKPDESKTMDVTGKTLGQIAGIVAENLKEYAEEVGAKVEADRRPRSFVITAIMSVCEHGSMNCTSNLREIPFPILKCDMGVGDGEGQSEAPAEPKPKTIH
jgi:hypothetical protein